MKPRATKPPMQEMKATRPAPNETSLQSSIAEAAYYRAERRGFAPGEELEDWLAAEKEVMQRVATSNCPT
jgi:DUF2934 family protein